MMCEVKYLFHTLVHPIDGFEGVKYGGKGTIRISLILVFMFFLQNVIAMAGTGFLFSFGDPEKVSVPTIFMVSIVIVLIWVVSNWAVGSLMDGEGRTHEIIIVSTYSLLPYIIISLINTLLSNFVTLEIMPFMNIISIISIVWSIIMIFTGMYQIHQLTFYRTIWMLALTILGMAVIVFLSVLVYSLFQQIYIFLYTIYSELMFRV